MWGAVNALGAGSESPSVLSRDYSGGWKSRDEPCGVRQSVRPYNGPALPFLVVACTAPDGTHWAVQAWQRLLPMRGFDPWKPSQAVMEFHLSHWSGPVASLEVSPNWTYGGQWQGLFGRLTYSDAPVFGTRTPTASKRDAYGRFVYIDTRNSVYGPGWKHDAGKVLHLRNGAVLLQLRPSGAAARLSGQRSSGACRRRPAPR